MSNLSEAIRFGLFLAAISTLSSVTGPAQVARKHVLVLYWDSKDFAPNVDFENAFRSASRSAAETIEYYSEYLESNRFPGERQSLLLRDYIRQKYAGRTIDVIVTQTNAALDFLSKYRDELFPHTPIVFAATERPSAAQLTSGAGATGIIYVNSYRKTVELALKLHPRTQHVFIVSGASSLGESWERMARADLEGINTTATISYLTDLPLKDLTARLRTLRERSVVLYVWQMARNEQGTLLRSQEILKLIAPSVRAPIYGMSFANVGLGIVGGYVWTLETQVGQLVEVMLRVANGARPADIPVESIRHVPMFDWRELQRWDIAEDRLPQGSVVRFREITMWQQYKGRIIAALTIFVLQAFLIGALLVERRRARQAAAALGESEERFRNMADTAPVFIWVSGPDKLCTFFNKRWLEFTGRTLEQELRKGWMDGLHPADLGRSSETYSSAFDARVPFQMEYRLRRNDGEYRSLLCVGVPRFQPDGLFIGYIGSCLDISELKRAQEATVAGQKLESIGLLASGIAHDFNNLLGGILTSAELALTEYAQGLPHGEEIERIKAAAVGGAQIVRELMIFGGTKSSEFESVDCSLLVREMSQVLKVSIPKNVALKTDLAEGLTTVHGNPAQIRQLVMNLILNASEAIGERSGEIRVTAKVVKGDQCTFFSYTPDASNREYVQLEVADTGAGMTKETKARIFDPFFTTKPGGRGLGLAVVQGVVHAHGGVINVVSSPDTGTAIQVFLPHAVIDNAAKGKPEKPATTLPGDECVPEPRTVLVIEDEDMLRVAVSKLLRKKNFVVIEAGDGSTGLSLFLTNAEHIDVVFLDLSLPGKSGRDVLTGLQRIRPDANVIVTSAYGLDQVRKSLDGLQYWRYMQKPYRLAEVEKLLRDIPSTALKIAYKAE